MANPIFLTPAGDLREVQPGEEQSALALGYTRATPEQAAFFEAARERQEKFGTPGQQAITALESAGSALTFGASPAIEQALGVPAENILARREENPGTHTAATLAGVGIPILATLGGSAAVQGGALATVARNTAPGLISRAGRAVESAVGGALPAATGTVGQVLSGAARVGAGSLVEGAFYSAGTVLDEAALGDIPTVAEAASVVGLGAVLGGGFGAIAGAGMVAVPAAVSGAKSAIGAGARRVGESAADAFERVTAAKNPGTPIKFMLEHRQEITALEAKVPGIMDSVAASKPETAAWLVKNADEIAEFEKSFPGIKDVLARADPDTAGKILANRSRLITDPIKRFEIAAEAGENLQKGYDDVGEALEATFRSARPAELASLAAQVPDDVAQKAAGQVRKRVASAIDHLTENQAEYPQSYVAKLKTILGGGEKAGHHGPGTPIPPRLDELLPSVRTTFDALGNRIDEVVPGADAATVFVELNKTKQLIGKLARFDRMASPEHQDAQRYLKGLYRDLRTTLEDETVWGELGARQKDFNRALSDFYDAKGDLEKRLMEGIAGEKEASATKINAWLNAMADPRSARRTKAFQDFLDTGRRLSDEMGKSGYDTAPALRATLNKIDAISVEARARAEVTRLVKQLQGHEIMSSGPAVPMEQQLAAGAARAIAPRAVTSVVQGTIDAVTNPARTVSVLAALERIGQRTSNAIDSGVSTLVRVGVKASYVGRGEAAAGIARSFSATPAESERAFKRRAAEVNRLRDPANLQAEIEEQTRDVYDHAPRLAAAMGVTFARKAGFLASKMPQVPEKKPLGPEWSPSRSEIAKWNRYAEAVDDPLVILKQAAAGTLTPEAVEAVEAVYPAQMAQIRAAIVDRLASGRVEVPYPQRLMLSLLLAQDVDGTLSPSMMARTQAAFAAPSKRAEQPQQQPGKGMTLGNRLQTPQQAAAGRR